MARRVVAAVLVLLATVLAPFAVGALWVERTVMDSPTFVETLAPLVDDPLVQQTIATEVSAAIVGQLDAQGRLTSVVGRLPDPLTSLVDSEAVIAAIASGVNGAIQSGVADYVHSERFGAVWSAITLELQEQFVALVDRDTTGAAVTLQDGRIVLETSVAVDKIQAALADSGVPFAGELSVPARQVVLADTPNLQLAVDALRVFMPVASWLWLVVLAMFAVGALLWRPRARGVLWSGLGLAVGGALTYAALGLGEAALADAAPFGFASVVSAVTAVLLRFLDNALLVMIALGLALIVAGWLAGGTRSGRTLRDLITGGPHRWGAPLRDTPLGRFTSEHPMLVPTLRAIVLGAAVVWLFAVGRLTPEIVLWVAVCAALLLVLVEVVEGSGLGREEARAGALLAPGVQVTGSGDTLVLADPSSPPAPPAAPAPPGKG